MHSPFHLRILFIFSTLLAAAFAVPNLHSGSFGLQFRNTDLFRGHRPAVSGHGKTQLQIIEAQYLYERARGRKKVGRLLECQDECERVYSLSSPLWGSCMGCCREVGVSVGYC